MPSELFEISVALEGSASDAEQAAESDLLSGLLFEAGASGLEELECDGRAVLRTHADGQAAARSLASEIQRRSDAAGLKVDVNISLRDDDGWRHHWMEFLGPQPLGDSFLMCPVGRQPRDPGARRIIVYQPEFAFGDGGHATTSLAAREVESFVAAHPGCSVLDVGTGSGVLAMVALLAGAAKVLALDVDPAALRAAECNARLNGVADRCRFSRGPLGGVSTRADLVVANIEILSLGPLLADLASTVAEGGQLTVTGFLLGAEDSVSLALAKRCVPVAGRHQEGDWVLLNARR